jgi:hypothetical protein
VGLAAQRKLFVYKTKSFGRFARRARIGDAVLWQTATLVNQGSIDADLGGGVIKQRIARAGKGKSSGVRSIILFRFQGRAVFVHGFAKKDVSNIKESELMAFRELADVILGYSDTEIAKRVADGALMEILPPKENEDA